MTQQTKQPKIKRKTKLRLVAEHLESGKSITSWDAINLYRVTRLSALIYELRNSGWSISTTSERNKTTGTVFSKYVLENPESISLVNI